MRGDPGLRTSDLMRHAAVGPAPHFIDPIDAKSFPCFLADKRKCRVHRLMQEQSVCGEPSPSRPEWEGGCHTAAQSWWANPGPRRRVS